MTKFDRHDQPYPSAAAASTPSMARSMMVVLSIGALLASLFLLVSGNGLLGTLLAVRMNDGATAPLLIGLVLSCYSFGFVAGAVLAGRIIARVGHIRGFAAFAAFACTAILLHSIAQDLVFWAILRVVTGFSIASMAMVTESWLNERATNAVRGFMLSIYMITNFSAAGAGQFLLYAAPVDGALLFVIAAVLTVLSLVPLALTTSAQPELPRRRRFGLIKLYRISPLALVGAAAIGMCTGAWGSMGAVFAEAEGLTVNQIAPFMGFGMLAGLLLQYPIGLLSDRMDRRILILAGNVLGGLLAIAIFVLALASGDKPDFVPLLIVTCACTAVLYILYPLCVAHANDFAEPGEATGVAGGLLMIWGAGTIFGPIIGSSVMSLFGSAALWLMVGVMLALTAAYAGWRMSRRPTSDEVLPYVTAPVLATPASVALDPRTEYFAQPATGDVDTVNEQSVDTPSQDPDPS